MEQVDWTNPEFFFRNKLVESSTTVEEALNIIRECNLRRSKRILAQAALCLVVKSSRRYQGIHIRASVDGLVFGPEAETKIYPGSFLIADYHKDLTPEKILSIGIEIWGVDGVIFESSFMIPSREPSKSLISVWIAYNGTKEPIEMEVHYVKVNLDAGPSYSDMKIIGHRGCGMNGAGMANMVESSRLELHRLKPKRCC